MIQTGHDGHRYDLHRRSIVALVRSNIQSHHARSVGMIAIDQQYFVGGFVDVQSARSVESRGGGRISAAGDDGGAKVGLEADG